MTTQRIMRGVAALALTTLAFAGCATRQKTGAAVGAGSGAVVGAGVGAAAGGKKGAIVGGAVGAATGAAGGALIGRYMDKQEAELKRDVESAKVVRKGDQLVVEFNSAILFDTGKAVLRTGAMHDLDQFAEVLKKYDQTNLVIEGHTDSTGGREINERLSQQRAEIVVEYLAVRGVGKNRLTPKGLAYDQPVASNETPDGRQSNRRVEIEIAPNESLKKVDAEERASLSPTGEPLATGK
jgi:outer membrane protein OmpA-like peptidoglycan-associated protein